MRAPEYPKDYANHDKLIKMFLSREILTDVDGGLRRAVAWLSGELEKLREAMREFDNDDNWLFEHEYADRNVRTGRCDTVYVGKWDPRVFATFAIRGEPFANTGKDESRDLSPFYTPNEKMTRIVKDRDAARAEVEKLKAQIAEMKGAK